MFRRKERLKEAALQTEAELQPEELKRLQRLSREGYLVGRVGRTFRQSKTKSSDKIQFDPDSLAFGDDDGELVEPAPPPDLSQTPVEMTVNELKFAHWLYDTPGIMKERDILHLLQDHEVRLVVPNKAIVPRMFVLKPGMCLFVGALARIDFLQAEKSCTFSVMVSSRVPIHITSLERADNIYQKHAGHALLGVPSGGEERMKQFPVLDPQDFTLEGRGYPEATADITLSSAGWVAVTAVKGDQVQLRVHGPAAAGFRLRTPPLLPHIVKLKGKRVPQASYQKMEVTGRLQGLSAAGAQTLQVMKKK
ncbi:nitric oxide-associated protein 1 [Austrofundulus limnaeus]|uniref:Nitric oxide-associated protein 1 n=1 Tax=Austrofundulus limnaeus TaxID=52670 RepID=A0A2I4AKV5_AUSLI|nr:PREDICTED: nitric oxide-associated protein 1-like [Austrofundulus limnaeus]